VGVCAIQPFARILKCRSFDSRRFAPVAQDDCQCALGHAIEYLSDEFMHAGGALTAHNPQVEAVQLLMGINRQIYFDCPIVPSLGERCRALLNMHRA